MVLIIAGAHLRGRDRVLLIILWWSFCLFLWPVTVLSYSDDRNTFFVSSAFSMQSRFTLYVWSIHSFILLVHLTKSRALSSLITVVSNHFHSVNILLFSSARSRDFDGMFGTGLPVSMYTTKTPIDMCRFNIRSSTQKNLNIFCKWHILIKLFYLYQRLSAETISSLKLN